MSAGSERGPGREGRRRERAGSRARAAAGRRAARPLAGRRAPPAGDKGWEEAAAPGCPLRAAGGGLSHFALRGE